MAYTIKQASEQLGVTARQVRRYIKEGKIEATLVPGKFGQEYQIAVLPAELIKEKTSEQPLDDAPDAVYNIIDKLIQENH